MLAALALLSGLFFQIEAQPSRTDAEQAQAAPPAPVLTKAPELLEYVDPVYPEDAKAAGIAGDVVLILTISETGAVAEVAVAQGVDPRLDAAAAEAAAALVFSPAEVDGIPAPVQIEFRYGFTLAPPPPPPAPEAEAPPPITLTGKVLVRGVRDPIEGAFVQSGEASTSTDAEGRFELALPPGAHNVQVKAPGFHPFLTEEQLAEGERVEATYFLLRKGKSPYETVVRAPRPKKEVSRITLAREELTKIPGTFGDPLRVLENLPGMARSSFLGGQLLVRGANPGDSGVYFDGVEIPILYHFGGLTSVIDAEFLEEIDFFPGGFGARYGRATAGIVDVSSRRLTGKQARGSAKVDLMDASVFWRQPVSDTLSFAVAGRRSYVDTLLGAAFAVAGVDRITLAPVYADYQAKADWDPSPNHALTLFVFGSDDTFALATPVGQRSRAAEFSLHLGFHRIMPSWEWKLSPELVLRTRPWVGITVQGFGGGEVAGPMQAEARLTRWEMGHRQDLTWRQSDRFTLRGGLDLYAVRGDAVIAAPLGFDLLAFPSPMQALPSEQEIDFTSGGSGLGAWVEAVYQPVHSLQLVPGFRHETYVFADQVHPTFDPRLTVRWKALEKTTLKAAAGLYHQPASIFVLNELSGNPKVRPEAASHYVLGLERELTEAIDLDFQLFVNQRFERVVGADSAEVSGGGVETELYVNEGKGRSFGGELLLRHKLTEDFFGWIAYTLMKSEERDHPGDAFVRTSYDQTHILTVVGSWRLGSGFEVGGRLRLVTGNPYTPVIGSVHDLDTDSWRSERGPYNSARMPTFHQLDLRVDWTTVQELWTLTVFLDLLNTYNQENIENFMYDYRYREQVGFPGLPLLPVMGVRGQW